MKLFAAVLMAVGCCFCAGARTVTGSNKVVYDVINETLKTVKVSNENKTIFNNMAVEVEIPAEVMNTATTSGYDDGPYYVVEIAPQAFEYCPGITKVSIKAPITKIPYNTFNGCTKLAEVELPSSVTLIETNAFQNCAGLNGISTIENVTEIGSNAFKGCSSLETIDLPEGLKNLRNNAFEDCKSLKTITLPSTLTEIERETFKNCSGMESVEIGSNITTINDNAFQSCTSLAAPVFPERLKKIKWEAFLDCKNLGKLTLNSGMKIENRAFKQCGITEIVWPQEELTLGTEVFMMVSKLREVTLPQWMTTLNSKTFMQCADLEKVVMEEGVETIDTEAFRNCPKLSTIEFCESLENIKESAFYDDAAITELNFPTTMTMLDKNAFWGCNGLTDIVLPEGASMGTQVFESCNLSSITFPQEGMGELQRQCFGTHPGIETITFPGWLKTLPASICYNWGSLKHVVFEEGVERTSDQSFSACRQIEELTFPQSMIEIGESSFTNCEGLKTLNFNEGLKRIVHGAFNHCSQLSEVVFPSTLEIVGDYAFYQNSSLQSVIFKDKEVDEEGNVIVAGDLKTIDNNAFDECKKLVSVHLPAGLERINQGAFQSNWLLRDVNWVNSLQFIGAKAFYDCRELTWVSFNAGETINQEAFNGCTKIGRIIFPDTPCTFGKDVFRYNQTITSFSFPEWMDEIPAGFCFQWTKLADITLHNGITVIGEDAFRSDAGIHDIDFPDFLKEIRANAFRDCSYTSERKNPDGSSMLDETGGKVYDYFGEVILPDDIKVGDSAFENSTVTKITFEGCAKFGDNSFKDLKKIKEFGFPSCLEKIPSGFCNGWENLERVYLPIECKVIEKNAFKGTKRLSLLAYTGYDPEAEGALQWVFPPQLEEIQDYAFAESAISEINWPDYKLKLGNYIFCDCKSLTSVTIPRWMDQLPPYTFYHTFPKTSNITEIRWEERTAGDPSEITIGFGAFQNNDKLAELNFPELKITLGASAFNNCQGLKGIGWNETGVTLGESAFLNCRGLETLSIPDYVTEIPKQCFQSTVGLTQVNLGKNVTRVGESAFYASGLSEIVWPDNLQAIDANGFRETNISELTIPGSCARVGKWSFYMCKNLKDVTISEGVNTLEEYVFQNCTAMESIRYASTLVGTYYGDYGNRNCKGCTSLTDVYLPEGMQQVGMNEFDGCTALKSITIPSTVKKIRSEAFSESGLIEATNYGDGVEIESRGFYNCVDLKVFNTYGSIRSLNQEAFRLDAALEEFNYYSETPIGDISTNVFDGCRNLRVFPHLGTGIVSYESFKDCSSLRQIFMPTGGDFYKGIDGSVRYLNGAKSLESIVFPYEGNMFRLRDSDIAGAPLRALSYSYAKGIVRPYGDIKDDKKTIRDYTAEENVELPNRGKAKLMVQRGERWKYMEAGYGDLFDIIEMKNPQVTIEGNLWSNFKFEDGENEYTAYLRWDVPYSDLNPDGETKVTIYRDNVEIGKVIFEQPEVVEKVEGVDCPHDVIRVRTTLNGEPNDFTGDFLYPVTDTNGKLLYYKRIYMSEPEYLYFDAYTHKRLVTNDKYGYTSWFVMVDHFVSPNLEKPGVTVPSEYVYTAKMEGYRYPVLKNNENLEPGEDGELYWTDWENPKFFETTPCVMSTAQAVPAISFPGLYDTWQVEADGNHELAATVPHKNRGGFYTIKLSMEPSVMALKGQDRDVSGDNTEDVIKGITIYNVTDGVQQWVADYPFPNRSGKYEFTIPPTDSPEPGKKYQVVTNSTYLGTFGSAILSIPDAPTLSADVLTAYLPDNGHGHEQVKWNGVLSLTPSVKATGYDGESLRFTPDDYYLGVWRSVNAMNSAQASFFTLSDMAEDATLIHHYKGVTAEGTSLPCDNCTLTPGATHDEDGGKILYSDYYDVPYGSSHNVDYSARLYVKVPDKSLGNETKWMIADASKDADGQIVSGVEEVSVDGTDGGRVNYFDMQGRWLSAPLPGQPYIRVTPQGARVVVTGK